MFTDRLALATLAVVLTFTQPAFSADSAEALLAQIRDRGARAIASDFARDERRFDLVLAQIERGSPAWLRVAAELRLQADGFVSEGLRYAVARAIPRAPRAVLKLIGKPFTIDDVCTSPYNEPEPGVAERYEREATAALRSVPDASLRDIRDGCLKRIASQPDPHL